MRVASELAAAVAMLEKRHNPLLQDSRDHNDYALGRIGVHIVAIAGRPSGVMGFTSTASVASYIRATLLQKRFKKVDSRRQDRRTDPRP